MSEKYEMVDKVVDIVAAYVAKNPVPAGELPGIICDIHRTLASLGKSIDLRVEALPEPAVPIKKSVNRDFLICLEDGRKLKSLKRHLRTKYGLTPAAYRQKWSLPKDYPMVAPSYSERRSVLAREIGLGQGIKTRPVTRGRGKTAKT